VCRSKHVEPSKNFGIINSATKQHLIGISTEMGLYSNALFFAGSVSIAHTELIGYAAEGTYKSE